MSSERNIYATVVQNLRIRYQRKLTFNFLRYLHSHSPFPFFIPDMLIHYKATCYVWSRGCRNARKTYFPQDQRRPCPRSGGTVFLTFQYVAGEAPAGGEIARYFRYYGNTIYHHLGCDRQFKQMSQIQRAIFCGRLVNIHQ